MKKIGKWLGVEEIASPGKKTKTFEIWNIFDNCSLGIVKWKASWRKYAFFPYVSSYYEWDCLRSIADFCYQETKRYKKERLW